MTLLPMENRESILCALKGFGKEKPNNIPPILDDYIKQISQNGETMLPWTFVKPLILHKFNKVVDNLIAENSSPEYFQLSQGVSELRQRVYNTLRSLGGIPFTIQRICELLDNPFRHYNRPDKYLRGFEKACMVVSTVDPQGNKILREDPRFPSRAGMEGCDASFGESLSPPSSPALGDTSRQPVSKSSDDDELTEDDENEDDDENPAESSSSASPSDPALPVSSAWTFGSGILKEVSPKTFSSDNEAHLGEAQTAVSVIDTFLAPDSELPCEDNLSKNRDLQENDNGTESSSAFIAGSSPTKSAVASDLVPSIVQILRPIGQLEAFVQNMAAEMPSLSSTDTLSVKRETKASSDAGQHVSDSFEMPCDSSPVVINRGKRRSVSPVLEDIELSGSTSDATTESDRTGYEQSPAKKRRLTECAPDTPGTDNQYSALSDSLAATLNDSPPIILCNPDGNNREPKSNEPTDHGLNLHQEFEHNADVEMASPVEYDSNACPTQEPHPAANADCEPDEQLDTLA